VFTGVAALLLARDTLSLTKPRIFLLGTVLGFLLAAFWLTREEGVWLLPALAFLALVAAVDAWLSRGVPGVAVVLWLGAIPVITFGSTLVAVAGLNYWHYGAFTLNEVQSGPFRAAYGALTRIKSNTSNRFIVFTKEAREAAYSVSGAALALGPAIDGEVGEKWRKVGWEQMQLDQCRDIPAGWFMWALRDAVAAAGHYPSAADALAYYDRLAGEINRACDDGQLSCLGERASLMAPFKWTYVRDAVEKMPALVAILLRFSEVGSFPSVGPRVMLLRFADLVGRFAVAAAPSVVLLLRGKGSAKLPSLLVRDRNGGPVEWKIDAVPRNEGAADAGVRTVDLELETDCVRASCELVITAGSEEQAFAIQGLKVNQLVIVPTLELSAIRSGLISAGEHRRHMQLRVLRGILFVYRLIIPVLAVVAGF